ncbi:GAF domain-containing protein [Knoellia remsis]|uniref:GAF domain-containing protein n=1 Tax=Knoellia remsis TaxID=407159 RepID=A0A2T0U7U7_9MICO|nr:GAF and ANTAR domain-containing protein [Knoellia remsis]PRY53996.1 GAF domain-containing protein [Knoellia remsis]
MTDLRTEAVTPPHEALLSEIGGVLSSVDELQEYLDRLVNAARKHIDGCDEVGVTLLVDGRPSTAAYTTVTTLEIDAIQYQLDEGPCLEAARERHEVIASLSEGDDRWPRFTEAVRRDGMKSLMAFPLVSGGESVGALNLYGKEEDAFEHFEISLARTTSQRAADALVSVLHLDGAQRLAGQLEQAMASRASIEQAKGVLMALRGIDEHEAFEWLRQVSQNRNVKVRDLAEQVISGVMKQDASAAAETTDGHRPERSPAG